MQPAADNESERKGFYAELASLQAYFEAMQPELEVTCGIQRWALKAM